VGSKPGRDVQVNSGLMYCWEFIISITEFSRLDEFSSPVRVEKTVTAQLPLRDSGTTEVSILDKRKDFCRPAYLLISGII